MRSSTAVMISVPEARRLPFTPPFAAVPAVPTSASSRRCRRAGTAAGAAAGRAGRRRVPLSRSAPEPPPAPCSGGDPEHGPHDRLFYPRLPPAMPATTTSRTAKTPYTRAVSRYGWAGSSDPDAHVAPSLKHPGHHVQQQQAGCRHESSLAIRPDVRRERAIFAQTIRQRAAMKRRACATTAPPASSGARNSTACAPASSSMASEVLGVREDLKRLQARGVSHRDVILLPGTRRDRVHARRMSEDFVLGDQRGRNVLENHHPRIDAHPRG